LTTDIRQKIGFCLYRGRIVLIDGSFHEAMNVTMRIASIGSLISFSEYLYIGKWLLGGQMFPWKILRLESNNKAFGLSGDLLSLLFHERVFPYIVLAGAISSAANILFAPSLFLNVFILAVLLLLQLRNRFGLEGSDQMLTILFTSGVVISLSSPPFQYMLYFTLCAHVGTCYLSSGLSKLSSADWRTGDAIVGIMSTEGYGHRLALQLFESHPLISKIVCGAVIAWQIAFVPLSFVSVETLAAVLIIGCFFHVLNAFFMGLNVFFWTFIALYPVYFSICRTVTLLQ
jgi:hypothetical protein